MQTHQDLVREYNLKLSAIQVLSKAQLRKAVFTKDYLKDMQSIHSSKHSKFYPRSKPDHLTATHEGHITLATHGTAIMKLYFNVMPFALMKKVTTESSPMKSVIALEENVGILLTV